MIESLVEGESKNWIGIIENEPFSLGSFAIIGVHVLNYISNRRRNVFSLTNS